MASDRAPPKTRGISDRQARIEAEREAKLALALRANLRRRKAEPRREPGAELLEPGDDDSA
jgi:hypothetical protein